MTPRSPTPPERYTTPLASTPSKKPLSRNPSSSSIELLAINVPPSTRSAVSSLEGSRDSSRQSPEDSPRLMRLFRQSKHQIKLTGATLEFSLQYQISQRALVLNVMRVRNVQIPIERKQDAKLCLSIQLKPDKFIWEAQTKIIQGTENPIFGEMFTISGFSLSKLHDCALLFRLNDFNVDQTIGEVTYSLRELQPDVLTSRSCQLQQPIGVVKVRLVAMEVIFLLLIECCAQFTPSLKCSTTKAYIGLFLVRGKLEYPVKISRIPVRTLLNRMKTLQDNHPTQVNRSSLYTCLTIKAQRVFWRERERSTRRS